MLAVYLYQNVAENTAYVVHGCPICSVVDVIKPNTNMVEWVSAKC